MVNTDYESLGLDFSLLNLSNNQDQSDQAPTERITTDWRTLSPLAMDVSAGSQRLSKSSVPRSSFDAMLGEHHGPRLGDAVPLSEIDVDADPTPRRKTEPQNGESSKSQDPNDAIPKTFSELTWGVEDHDAVQVRERPDSIHSFRRVNTPLQANTGSDSNGDESSAIWSGNSTYRYCDEKDPERSIASNPYFAWTRPWRQRAGVIPGTWLCPHCERGLNVEEDKQTKGMKNEYKRLKIRPPFERLEGWGILQRKCAFCDNHAFCKLFKHVATQEPANVFMRR